MENDDNCWKHERDTQYDSPLQEIIKTNFLSDQYLMSESEKDSDKGFQLFDEDFGFNMPEVNLDLSSAKYHVQEEKQKDPLNVANCLYAAHEQAEKVFDQSPMGLNLEDQDVDFKFAFERNIQCETPRVYFMEKSRNVYEPKFAHPGDESPVKKAEPTPETNKVQIQVQDTESIVSNSEVRRSRGLALRADVMNKNLFRAIRRECKTIFEAYCSKNLLSNSRSKRIFKSNLKRFSQHILESTSVEWKSRRDFSSTEFNKYMGIFINTCLMKKVFDETAEQEKVNEFNNLLYSYSHKKFYDFIRVPEVSTVIRMTFEQTGVSGFIDHHPTLSVNKEEYEHHIANILKQI